MKQFKDLEEFYRAAMAWYEDILIQEDKDLRESNKIEFTTYPTTSLTFLAGESKELSFVERFYNACPLLGYDVSNISLKKFK